MYTRPVELVDGVIVAELAAGWDLAVDEVEYLPVGFGSHHWRAEGGGERWFVTVDDFDAKRWTPDETWDEGYARLEAAIATSRALRDHGLEFVIAPEPTGEGKVLRRLDRFALALYRQVDGRTHPYGPFRSAEDRRAVLDLVVRLHAAPVVAPAWADDFELRNREDLDGRSTIWTASGTPGRTASRVARSSSRANPRCAATSRRTTVWPTTPARTPSAWCSPTASHMRPTRS